MRMEKEFQLSQRPTKELIVSVHALDRFAERVLHLDFTEEEFGFMPRDKMEEIDKIIKDTINQKHEYIHQLSTGNCYSSKYKCTFVVINSVVVTVKTNESNHKKNNLLHDSSYTKTKKRKDKERLLKEMEQER